MLVVFSILCVGLGLTRQRQLDVGGAGVSYGHPSLEGDGQLYNERQDTPGGQREPAVRGEVQEPLLSGEGCRHRAGTIKRFIKYEKQYYVGRQPCNYIM